MDVQHLFDILLGLVVSVMGFFAKHTYTKIEKTEADLAAFKTHVAIEHPTNSNIDKRFDKMEKMLERVGEKLDKVLEK